jgi:hypothetical protein
MMPCLEVNSNLNLDINFTKLNIIMDFFKYFTHKIHLWEFAFEFFNGLLGCMLNI